MTGSQSLDSATAGQVREASDGRAAMRATASAVISRLVIAGLGWAGTVLIVRSLSPDSWGQYSFVFGLLGLLAVFTDLGVGRIVLAHLITTDRMEVEATATAFVALRALLGLIGYLLAVGYVLLAGMPGEVVRATALAGLVVVFATPSHALSVLYQSRHQLGFVAVVETLGQVVQLALTVAAALYAPLLLVFIVPAVINELLGLVLKLGGVTRGRLGFGFSRRLQVRRWRRYLREALPLAIGYGLTFALVKVDVLLLEALGGFSEVGVYSVAYKFSDVLDLVSMAAVAPFATMMVAAWPDIGLLVQRARQASILVAMLAAAAIAAFVPVARPLLTLLYGDDYDGAVFSAVLLLIASAATALILVGIAVLAATGDHRKYPWVPAGGLLVNVLGNLWAIPRWGVDGAAVVSVISMWLTAAVLWAVVAGSVHSVRVLPVAPLLRLTALTGIVTALAAWAVAAGMPWYLIPVPAVTVLLLSAHAVGATRELLASKKESVE